MVEERNYKMEKVLVFKYSHEDKKEDAEKLSEYLNRCGLGFVMYDDGAYILFKVKRPLGLKWDDILKIVNTVHPAKYSYENAIILLGEDLQYHEYVVMEARL